MAGVLKNPAEAAAPVIERIVENDKTPWYRKRNLRYLYLIFIPTCLGVEMTSGFDSSMMNGLQSVPYWDAFFGKPRGSILGLISAMYSLGGMFALPFIPFIVDRFGRRFAIVFGSVIMLVGAALQTASVNFAMFVVARFFLGLGIPFAIVGASSLLSELSHPKERAFMTSIFNTSWFVGAIVAAGTTLGTFSMQSDWSWRIPSILQVLPSAMQILFMYFLPESPRWLVSKGRQDEAYEILVTYHCEGDREAELARVELAQIESTLAIEMELAKQSWRDIIATPANRRRLLIGSCLGLFTQWSGNGLTSYYLARILETVGITDARTQNLINLSLTCWGMINAATFALCVLRFRRRTMYLTCTISLLLIFTSWTIASAKFAENRSPDSANAVLAMIYLMSPAYNIGYNALTYTFLTELWPFATRAKGIAIFQWWGRGAGFFNQFVNPIGIQNAGWKYYTSYCVFLLFEVLFVYFFFPETSGRTLEELTFLFEGEEVRADQAKRTEQALGDVMSANTEHKEKEFVEHVEGRNV